MRVKWDRERVVRAVAWHRARAEEAETFLGKLVCEALEEGDSYADVEAVEEHGSDRTGPRDATVRNGEVRVDD